MHLVLMGIVTLALFLFLLRYFPLFRYVTLCIAVAAGAIVWWVEAAKPPRLSQSRTSAVWPEPAGQRPPLDCFSDPPKSLAIKCPARSRP